MKSLLKKKIILSLFGGSIFMALGGSVLTAYSCKEKNDILEEYSKTDDFLQRFNSELKNLDDQFTTNKINKEEYEEGINHISSIGFVEETLKSEDSQYSQALYDRNLKISVGAGMTFIGITGGAVSYIGLENIQKVIKREKKIEAIGNLIEKLNSEEDLLNRNL